jgi:aryl carrier-like protein
LGCPGELLIEGPILADGYLNDEIKTLNAFVDSPIWLLRGNAASGQAGRRGRVYKTGDIARYNSDGSLTYVARKDTQVKIRGQRVELGEVERHVSECFPKARHVVAEVLAISGNDSPGNKTTTQVLAAFVSLNDADKSDQDIIKVIPAPKHVSQHLKRCLPNYMNPGCFFAMDDKRVLSASGKIDRKVLVKLAVGLTMNELVELGRATGALGGGEQRVEARPPSGQAEMKLRDLWAKTLNISSSTIRSSEDSFFQLGGDSVAAIKLVSECRRAGIALSVAQIFESPVLLDQAQLICSIDGNEMGSSAMRPFSLLPLGSESAEEQTRLEEIAGMCNYDGQWDRGCLSLYPSPRGPTLPDSKGLSGLCFAEGLESLVRNRRWPFSEGMGQHRGVHSNTAHLYCEASGSRLPSGSCPKGSLGTFCSQRQRLWSVVATQDRVMRFSESQSQAVMRLLQAWKGPLVRQLQQFLSGSLSSTTNRPPLMTSSRLSRAGRVL